MSNKTPTDKTAAGPQVGRTISSEIAITSRPDSGFSSSLDRSTPAYFEPGFEPMQPIAINLANVMSPVNQSTSQHSELDWDGQMRSFRPLESPRGKDPSIVCDTERRSPLVRIIDASPMRTTCECCHECRFLNSISPIQTTSTSTMGRRLLRPAYRPRSAPQNDNFMLEDLDEDVEEELDDVSPPQAMVSRSTWIPKINRGSAFVFRPTQTLNRGVPIHRVRSAYTQTPTVFSAAATHQPSPCLANRRRIHRVSRFTANIRPQSAPLSDVSADYTVPATGPLIHHEVLDIEFPPINIPPLLNLASYDEVDDMDGSQELDHILPSSASCMPDVVPASELVADDDDDDEDDNDDESSPPPTFRFFPSRPRSISISTDMATSASLQRTRPRVCRSRRHSYHNENLASIAARMAEIGDNFDQRLTARRHSPSWHMPDFGSLSRASSSSLRWLSSSLADLAVRPVSCVRNLFTSHTNVTTTDSAVQTPFRPQPAASAKPPSNDISNCFF